MNENDENASLPFKKKSDALRVAKRCRDKILTFNRCIVNKEGGPKSDIEKKRSKEKIFLTIFIIKCCSAAAAIAIIIFIIQFIE